MSVTQSKQKQNTLLLDDFFSAIRDGNPFRSNRVNEPSIYDVDVRSIHEKEFSKLTTCAEQALTQRCGVGVLLLGSAGVGKSHLLSRLYRWASEVVGQENCPQACYVFLHNILVDAERFPRYLLKSVISSLSGGNQGPLHQTQLFSLIQHSVRRLIRDAGKSQATFSEARELFHGGFLHTVGSRKVYDVLYQFFRYASPRKNPGSRYTKLATAALEWLAGEEIDADLGRALGLKVRNQESVSLQDDQDVEQVLISLSELAYLRKQPFALCIDQVDNLAQDKVKALTRFLHPLLDHARNLLVIVSGVKATLLDFKLSGAIQGSTWDRIAEYQVEMARINKKDARHILEARLEQFHESFLNVEAVHQKIQEDTLFPLGLAWFDEKLGDALEVRPRDILIWARDAWAAQQATIRSKGAELWLREWPGGGAPPPPPKQTIEQVIDAQVDRKITEHLNQRRLHQGSLPPDADNLAELVLALLEHCRGKREGYTFRGGQRLAKEGAKLPPYHLDISEEGSEPGKLSTTGILFVTTMGNSATGALRRFLEHKNPPGRRILVTDEERRPLKLGATGQEYLRDLKKLESNKKFSHIKLNFEQYAMLDALEAVIGMARVGDLEVEWPRGTIRPVQEHEVIASYHRCDRYRKHPVLRPLLTKEPVSPVRQNAGQVVLNSLDVRKHIMAQLAWRLGMSAYEVTNSYLKSNPSLKIAFEEALPQVKTVASKMHAEGLIYATPADDDLSLLLRK